MILAAFSIWQADPLGLFAAPVYVAYIDRFQIVPEERALGRLFGDAYADWCRHVRRWV
jgi:protein-S-isoprenylcysteine O-methyltransferase Ste14